MARTQTLVQLNDELLTRLDERAARERRSRSTLIRQAVEQFLSDDLAAEVDGQIVEGYRRVPETDVDDRRAHAAARDVVRDEPW